MGKFKINKSIILAKVLSILENKKITGINPNPRSSSAFIKNNSKCLELLRTKRVYLNLPSEHVL
jgi:hypothetical protein